MWLSWRCRGSSRLREAGTIRGRKIPNDTCIYLRVGVVAGTRVWSLLLSHMIMVTCYSRANQFCLAVEYTTEEKAVCVARFVYLFEKLAFVSNRRSSYWEFERHVERTDIWAVH